MHPLASTSPVVSSLEFAPLEFVSSSVPNV